MSPGRFPDLGDLRITACSAAPRSFSQLGHVLLRLWTPRHPPCTLCSLTTLFCIRCSHLHGRCRPSRCGTASRRTVVSAPWSPLHSRFTSFSKSARAARRSARPSGTAPRCAHRVPSRTHSVSARARPARPCDTAHAGGGDGTRTHDPLVANQVLYQLSYAPGSAQPAPTDHGWPGLGRPVVGLTGLEPETSRLSGGRSNQLSYSPGCSARKRSIAKQSVRRHHRASRALRLDARLPSRGGVRLVGRKGGPRSCTCSLCSTPCPPACADGQGSNMIPLERR